MLYISLQTEDESVPIETAVAASGSKLPVYGMLNKTTNKIILFDIFISFTHTLSSSKSSADA